MTQPQIPADGFSHRDAVSLKRARAAQLGMLPKAPLIPGLEIHAYYEACESLGGDFYDFIPLAPDKLGILVGDVSGHGIDAALLMAAAKKCIHIRAEGRESPREALLVAIEDLAHEIPPSSFISIFYGVLDHAAGTLTFVSAGHPPPFLVNSRRKPRVTELRSRGMVFNPSVAARLPDELGETRVELSRGDTLVLYTDGLTESMNAAREQYGERRLPGLLEQMAGQTAAALGQAILKDVANFRNGKPGADDHTQLVLRWLEPRESAPNSKHAADLTTNLRADRSSFVGRGREVGELTELLRQPGRLVTLTGAAGIGKSRLALAVGRKLRELFSCGVLLVDLTEAHQPEDLLNLVSQTLGTSDKTHRDDREALISLLRLRQPLLLILDNLEHLAQRCAQLVQQWLDAVPQLSVLATSRVLLGISGEREFKLTPLPLETLGAGNTSDLPDAVALFVERAREVRPDFTLEGKNREIVQAICASVDGIPLAVELAAARLRIATLDQVLAQLRKPPPAASLRQVSAASRQQSMFDAVAWSYLLLDDWEKAAFEQLCVFRGGFFMEDAEAVLDISRFGAQRDCVAALSSLYDKSLLYGEDTAFGRRFRMYSVVRDFGVEQASAHMNPRAREELLIRHAEYFGQTAYMEFQRRYGRDAAEAQQLIDYCRENLLATLDSAPALGLNERAAQVAQVLAWNYLERGHANAAMQVSARALKLPISPTSGYYLQLLNLTARLHLGMDSELVRDADALVEQVARANDWLPFAEALCLRAAIHRVRADIDAALVDVERAEDAAKEKGVVALPSIYLEWGRLLHLRAKHEEAQAMLVRSEAVARKTGNHLVLVSARMIKVNILLETGGPEKALKLLEEIEPLGAQLRSRMVTAHLQSVRGLILRQLGRLREALECHSRALETYKLTGDISGLGNEAAHKANTFLLVGQPQKALEFAGLAAAYGAQTKNQQSCAIFSYLRSRALYKLGRYFEAFDACRESTTFWRKLSAKAFYLLQLPLEALCLTRLGRTDEARAVLEEVLPEIGPILAPNDGPEFMCMVALAQLERAQGNSSPARNALARAKEIASRRGFSQSGGTLVVNTVWPDFEELCVALADAPAREKAAADLSIVSAPLPGTHARKGSFDSHRLRSPRPKVEKAGPVKIQCKRCSRVMIGPMRRFENKRACSHCGARPFEFLVL